jgi:hypothetical protein
VPTALADIWLHEAHASPRANDMTAGVGYYGHHSPIVYSDPRQPHTEPYESAPLDYRRGPDRSTDQDRA